MKIARLAALRPGMPGEAVAALLGKLWSQPNEHGQVPGTHNRGFDVRMDASGALGRVGFYKSFPAGVPIERLAIGMPLAEALAARPGLQLFDNGPEDPADWLQYRDATDEGCTLVMRVRKGAILALELHQPGAVYPEPARLLADPNLTVAYDLLRTPQQRLPASGRGAEWAGGWSLGLPPGITPVQWPLSERLGYPLRHAFTLHVPSQYRTQGAQWVALSVFVDDQLEELPASSAIQAFFAAPLPAQPPADPALSPFWYNRTERPPMQFDMHDALGTRYAALWLTQAQFDGALCSPPELQGNPLLGHPPGWLSNSYSDYFPHVHVRNPGMAAYAWLPGEGRAAGIETAFAIQAQRREGDPNIGKPPREREEECADSGYVPAFSGEQGQALELERFLGRNHLGGTMFPEQNYPAFGPYYLECMEDFGGFNFGGGVGQVDLQTMALAWDCS